MRALKERPPNEIGPPSFGEDARAYIQNLSLGSNGSEDGEDHQPEQPRDRPLDPRWIFEDRALADEILALLRPPTDRHADAWERLLAAAVVAGYSSRPWMSYSRGPNYYAAARRYLPPTFTLRTVREGVGRMTACGLLVHHKKPPGYRLGYQSRFRLADLPQEPPRLVRLRHREPLVLRVDKQPIVYPQTEQTRRLRRGLAELNEMARGMEIRFPYFVPFPGAESYLTGTELHQVFTNDFAHHGRLYADYQNTPRDKRKHMLIGGEETVEWDYSELHIRLLAAERGIDFGETDPYQVPGVERKDAKAAVNIAINAPTERSAVLALAERFGRTRGSQERARECIDRVKAYHRRLGDVFGRDEGLRLMRRDADIAEAVMRHHGTAGKPCLPIHDSFRVRAEDGPFLEAVMTDVYLEKVGQKPKLKMAA